MAEMFCCGVAMAYEAGESNDTGDFEDWLACQKCGGIIHPIPKPPAKRKVEEAALRPAQQNAGGRS